MRSARCVVLAVAALAGSLAGCVVDTTYDLYVENASGRPVHADIAAWFEEAAGPRRELGNVTLAPVHTGKVMEFERPCEKRLAGWLVVQASLDNGTVVGFRDEWRADGCSVQDCTLWFGPDRVRFDCLWK